MGVCGRVLVEAESQRLSVYGSLDLDSALDLDSQVLVPRLGDPNDPVTLDLTGLSDLEPDAMHLLLWRQRLSSPGAGRLLIRISVDQSACVV